MIFGKLITSFLISKVSAIYLGPSGYAIVGNFKNVLQGVLGITASGFESGAIKYISENKTDKDSLKLVVSSILVLSSIISILVGFVLFVFSKTLSIYILKDASLAFIFKYLALLLPLISWNFLIIYILNGLQEFKTYVSIITISNIFSAFATLILIHLFSLKGALFASMLIPALSFFLSLLFNNVRTLFFLAIRNFKSISIKFISSIGIYVLMATYSSILISIVYVLIRNNIISNIDIETAGFWEAMNKISSFYMIFFSSLITLYLLPQLTVNKTLKGYYSIMRVYFRYIIPLMLLLFTGLFFLKSIIIKILFTKEFITVNDFFHLQILGDFIKVIAFSLAYQFHAKKMLTFYFITDALLYISFYIFSLYFIKLFSIQGVFYAYIVSTLLYLILVITFLFFKNKNYLKNDV